MKTVGEILHGKGHDIWWVAPDDSVLDALKLMAQKNVGAVLVLDASHLVGILSERDFARKVALEGISAQDTRVAEIMTERVMCVPTDETLDRCMVLMTIKRIRHLPITENNKLVGLISIGDVVKTIISEQGARISELEEHIERFGDYLWGYE